MGDWNMSLLPADRASGNTPSKTILQLFPLLPNICGNTSGDSKLADVWRRRYKGLRDFFLRNPAQCQSRVDRIYVSDRIGSHARN